MRIVEGAGLRRPLFSLARSSLARLLHDPVLLGVVLVVFALVGLFVVYPLGRVFVVSLFHRGTFNPRYFLYFLEGRPYLVRPFLNSLTVGALVALMGTLVGFVFAYVVTRTAVPGKTAFRWLAMLPIISPPFLLALSAILLLGENGLVTRCSTPASACAGASTGFRGWCSRRPWPTSPWPSSPWKGSWAASIRPWRNRPWTLGPPSSGPSCG